MKLDFGTKPLIYPQPVLIISSYNQDGTANAMNAAWGSVCDYTKISIVLDKNHKTVQNIKEHKDLILTKKTGLMSILIL